MLETLADFRAVRLPLERLPEALPPLRPREFSIANDAGKGTLELAVAMVQYRTALKAPRVGLCTAFFRSLAISVLPSPLCPPFARRPGTLQTNVRASPS